MRSRPAAHAQRLSALTLLGTLGVALALALASAAQAAEVPIPPSPTTWVTDGAGLLDLTTRDALEARLANYNHATGHQVLVWIGTTTGDTPLEDWTIHAFTAWKVGRKQLDDGLVLFMFTQDRKVRIEVGYGLEGTVTDATASSIIRNQIVPQMKAGDPDGAVTAGVSALLATIGGEQAVPAAPSGQQGENGGGLSLVEILLIVLVIWFAFSILAALARGRWRAYTIGSGGAFGGFAGGGWGGWGGSSNGGAGFSGGGGAGGGGGASGGW